MKNSKILAAMLLAGTTIPGSKGQTITDTPLLKLNQLVVYNNSFSDGQSGTQHFEPVSGNASGTFYATALSWSADNNELYFMGKVIIDIENNKFVGKGKFNVIGKVYYLVVYGRPVAPGTKINIDEHKKHKITRLPAGRQGVVEIELASDTN